MFKNAMIAVLVICTCLISVSVHSQVNNSSISKEKMDVTITIDGEASESDLSDIKCMLQEHGIEAKFSRIERKNGEITGIRIDLDDLGGSMTSSQISMMKPIPEISFGRRKGQLFIDQGNTSLSNFAFIGGSNQMPFPMEMDSILPNLPQRFSFSFDDLFHKDSMLIAGGQFQDLEKIKQKMRELMESRGQHMPEMDWAFSSYNGPKYRFRDDPNLEKLIIIDGEEADFNALNELALQDKLDTVDVLKSKTAMSIYGKKAKDGAIIATTKR